MDHGHLFSEKGKNRIVYSGNICSLQSTIIVLFLCVCVNLLTVANLHLAVKCLHRKKSVKTEG